MLKSEVLLKCKLEGKRLCDNHPAQAQIYDDNADVKIVAAGRNFGKSILMILECLKYISDKKESVCFFVFPTMDMAAKIIWPDLVKIIQAQGWKHKANRHSHSVEFPNGNKIYLASADKPDRLRGLRIDFLGVDEYASMRDQTLWEEILEPTLSSKSKCLITSTPKGYDGFWKLWMLGQDSNNKRYKSWQFKSTDNPTDEVYNKRVEQEKLIKDPRLFRQEHEASFEVSAGKVSPDFSRKIHVFENLIDFDKQLRVSCDFNISPMAWSVFKIVSRELITANYPDNLKTDWLRHMTYQSEVMYIIKELRTEECSTSLQCGILQTYLQSIGYNGTITFYGDSTGKAKDTTGNVNDNTGKISSDWDIIKMYFPNSYTKFGTNTVQRNRINALNMKIKNSNNEIGLLIHKDCEYSIRDLEQVSWDASGRQIDKTIERSKGGHFYDAISYACQQEWDLKYTKPGLYFMDLNFSAVSNNKVFV